MLIAEAKALHNEFHIPSHILKHCELVSGIAKQIGEKYIQKGNNVNLDNLIIAGLVHDLFRVIDISEENYADLCKNAEEYDTNTWDLMRMRYKGKTHSKAAFDFFTQKGEEELANIIKKHYFKAILDTEDAPTTLEEKILTYADKRVMHDKIVSLKERVEDGQKRHGSIDDDSQKIGQIYNAYYALEKELLEPIGMKPEEVGADM